MKNIAIVGFGMMGKTHLEALQKIETANVTVIVEPVPEKQQEAKAFTAENNLDIDIIDSLDNCIVRNDVDWVSLCVPTHLHKDLSIKILSAGKDVVCEKPMALSLQECDEMIDAARQTEQTLFIAQCIRFWPEYAHLKKTIDSGELGKLLSLTMQRISGPPGWGDWFFDSNKSGGCVMDLHVHDLDFINYALGLPKAVFSRGVNHESGMNLAVTTQYVFENELICTAEGSWALPAGFKMAFTAVFEKGMLAYDSSQEPTYTLLEQGQESPVPVHVVNSDGYEQEYRYFLQTQEEGMPLKDIDPFSVRESIRLALAEKESLETGKIIQL